MDGPDYKQERGREGCRPATGTRWRCHGQTRQELVGVLYFGNFEHHSTNGKHREGVQSTASSPWVKSEPRIVQRWRVAWDGGWLGCVAWAGATGQERLRQGNKMGQRGSRLDLYSLGTTPRKERWRLRKGFGDGVYGKCWPRWHEEEDDGAIANAWAQGDSDSRHGSGYQRDTERERTRARARGVGPAAS
jgi:hypothetical protein